MASATLADISFEDAAERYSGRVPYLPEFFAEAAKVFNLSHASTLLDLGCGTGAVSLGFAPYCGSVLGVDISANMLGHRRGTPANVKFLQADLNSDGTKLPVVADLVVFGMSVHYLRKDRLMALLDTVTTSSTALFVCGTAISSQTPWYAAYRKLRDQYNTLTEPLDLFGHVVFSRTPWSRGRVLRAAVRRAFSARDLLNETLSHPHLDAILKEKDDFERRLESLLSPYCTTGNQAVAEIINWGVEYRRSPVTA